MKAASQLPALALLLFVSSAQARVFSFGDSSLAPFLRGTGGLSAVGQDPFINSSGTNTEISESTKFNYSGELGMAIGITETLNMRLGIEAIQHRPVKEAKGLSPSGAERFSLESSVFIFNPNVTFEYIFNTMGDWRFFAGGGVGMAQVTVENRYAMTATGTADLGPGDFNEKMEGSGYSMQVGAGFETLFTDNVTFSMDLGYRYLPITSLKYKGDTDNIVGFPGGVQKGEKVVNMDGSTRSLDLSGIYAGLMFKFYLHFL